MNGKIEKERNQTTGLLIINAIIWIPLIIIILLIIGISKVEAASYRTRIFNHSNTQVVDNQSTANSEYNGVSKRSLITYKEDGTLPANKKVWLSYYIVYGQRSYVYSELGLYDFQIWYVDPNGNIHDVETQCSPTGSFTRGNYDSNNPLATRLYQWKGQATCEFIPDYQVHSILIEIDWQWGGSLQPIVINGNQKTAINLSNFKYTGTPSEAQDIIAAIDLNNQRMYELQIHNEQQAQQRHSELMNDLRYMNGLQQIDYSDLNTEHQKQQQILAQMDNVDFSDLSITVDANANATVWDIVERALFTNLAVGGMVLTLLGLGILKLILLR